MPVPNTHMPVPNTHNAEAHWLTPMPIVPHTSVPNVAKFHYMIPNVHCPPHFSTLVKVLGSTRLHVELRPGQNTL